MSADKWEECPQCLDRATAEHEKLVKQHQEHYGVLSPEEWMEEGRQLDLFNGMIDNTFREDFEWWTEEGKLLGSWRGSCTMCGLTFTHKVGPVRFYGTKEEGE